MYFCLLVSMELIQNKTKDQIFGFLVLRENLLLSAKQQPESEPLHTLSEPMLSFRKSVFCDVCGWIVLTTHIKRIWVPVKMIAWHFSIVRVIILPQLYQLLVCQSFFVLFPDCRCLILGLKKTASLFVNDFYYRVAVLPVIDILPVNLKCSVQKHARTAKKLELAVKNVKKNYLYPCW